MWNIFRCIRMANAGRAATCKPDARPRVKPTSVEAFVAANKPDARNSDPEWEAWENSVLLHDSQLFPESPPAKPR